jgi:type I restriction enzyme, S subunit
MERYARYKDSGIAWIGEIPEHWKTVALKWLSKIYAGGTPDKNKSEYWLNGNIPWLNSGTVNQFIITEPSEYISEEGFANSSAKWIEEGSLVMALAGQGKTKGMTGFVTFRTTCNQSLAVIQPKQIIDGKFLLYFLTRNYFYIRGLAGEGKRDGLNLEIIGSLYIPLFDLEEQKTIAAFLDRKTAEIDELIAQKERLIALYEEEKTAIINEAVTKGINPDVKLKPTAIDWLGDIPEHWSFRKLKYLVLKVGSGITPKGGASVYQLEGIPLLRSQNVYFDGLRLDDVAYISESINQEMSNSQVLSGDVLLNITGGSIGRCFYVDDSLGVANVNQHVCIVRPSKKIKTKFLYLILRSNLGQKQIDIEQTGGNREGLNFEALKNFLVPDIQIEEQKAIIEYIEKETARIDTKIAKTKRIIELQKEYRTALISEAVTGKIKIPELVS